jgi:hypothetical protein
VQNHRWKFLEMTNLWDVAPEVLSWITEHVEAFDIGKLWSCGCKSLNWKLGKAGGVTTFTFSTTPIYRVIWPRSIVNFELLQSLTIHNNVYHGKFPKIQPDIATIPRKLKKLRLQFDGDLDFLISSMANDPTLFQHLDELDIDASARRDFPWTLLQLPSISSIEISSVTDKISLSQLPTTLTQLRVRCKYIENPTEHFPSSLTVLQLDLSIPHPNLFSTLPESLQKLYLTGDGVKTSLSEQDWTMIPRDLDSFTLETFEVPIEKLYALPNTLKKLRFNGMRTRTIEKAIEILKALPPSLEEIWGIYPGVITAEIAALLPRSSKQMLYEEMSWDAIPLLPPGMGRVRVPATPVPSFIKSLPPVEGVAVPRLTTELAAIFPPGMNSLTIDAFTAPREAIALLPRGITFIIAMRDALFEDVESWKDLPPELKTMDVMPITIRSDGENWIPVPPESSGWFPSTLAEITIGDLDITKSDWFSHFPPTLETLKVATKDLPKKSLQKLSASGLRLLRVLEFKLRSIPRHGVAIFVRTMPRTLTGFSFQLTDDRDVETDIANSDVMDLPVAITDLELPNTPKITSECYSYLPEYLRTFRFTSGYSDTWFDDLRNAPV